MTHVTRLRPWVVLTVLTYLGLLCVIGSMRHSSESTQDYIYKQEHHGSPGLILNTVVDIGKLKRLTLIFLSCVALLDSVTILVAHFFTFSHKHIGNYLKVQMGCSKKEKEG